MTRWNAPDKTAATMTAFQMVFIPIIHATASAARNPTTKSPRGVQ